MPVGAVQMVGRHSNVDGVKIVLSHVRFAKVGVKPSAQTDVQTALSSTLAPWEHAGLAAFGMPVGAWHGPSKQVNDAGERVPKLQLKLSTMPKLSVVVVGL
jgi:hypothetical protein